jgi:putative monooxygenase
VSADITAGTPQSTEVPPKVNVADVAANRRRGGDIRVVLSPRTVGCTSGFSGVLTLATGEHVTEHYHPYSEEFLHVVSGELRLRLDGLGGPIIDLGPGDAYLVPKERRHRLVNAGPGEAIVVFALAPLAPRPELGHVDTEDPADPAALQPDVGGAT